MSWQRAVLSKSACSIIKFEPVMNDTENLGPVPGTGRYTLAHMGPISSGRLQSPRVVGQSINQSVVQVLNLCFYRF